MANLKEIRIRIGSVSSTMQITSAMKMVSAAKLKIAYIRTYKINAIISNCCNNYGPFQFPEKLIPKIILYSKDKRLSHSGKYLSHCVNYNISMFSLLLEIENNIKTFYTGIISLLSTIASPFFKKSPFMYKTFLAGGQFRWQSFSAGGAGRRELTRLVELRLI